MTSRVHDRVVKADKSPCRKPCGMSRELGRCGKWSAKSTMSMSSVEMFSSRRGGVEDNPPVLTPDDRPLSKNEAATPTSHPASTHPLVSIDRANSSIDTASRTARRVSRPSSPFQTNVASLRCLREHRCGVDSGSEAGDSRELYNKQSLRLASTTASVVDGASSNAEQETSREVLQVTPSPDAKVAEDLGTNLYRKRLPR